MLNSLKKIKLIAGVSLLVESFTFAVLALILFAKKKTLSGVFMFLSLIGGLVGGIMIYKHLTEETSEEYNNFYDYDFTDDFDFETEDTNIPEDDTASESEFEEQ